MTITKHDRRSDERLERLRRDPDVIYHRRATERPERFIPEISVTGYVDTLELLGRRDDESDANLSPDNADGA